MTTTFRDPERHIARNVEVRTPEETLQLEMADAFVVSYGLSGDELLEFLLPLRMLYRRPDTRLSVRAWRFLDDLCRAIDDQHIDTLPPLQRSGTPVLTA